MKQQNLILLASASLLMMLSFQNCRNGIQANDLPATVEPLQTHTFDDTGMNPLSESEINPAVPENPYQQDIPQLALLPLAGEWASVAFEDNILNADGGDRDYNDAVFNFKISEQYNSENQLVRIFMEVRLREMLSASNHYLHLIPSGKASTHFDNISQSTLAAFNGQGNAKITYADGSVSNVTSVNGKKLTLFKSTAGVKGTVTKLQIDILSPELNVNAAAQKFVNYKKYRLILQNRSQDRVGIDIAELNSSDEMLANANGYPFGFMIPTDWAPPGEKQLIDDKYSNFHKYREWLNNQSAPISDQALNWYLP